MKKGHQTYISTSSRILSFSVIALCLGNGGLQMLRISVENSWRIGNNCLLAKTSLLNRYLLIREEAHKRCKTTDMTPREESVDAAEGGGRSVQGTDRALLQFATILLITVIDTRKDQRYSLPFSSTIGRVSMEYLAKIIWEGGCFKPNLWDRILLKPIWEAQPSPWSSICWTRRKKRELIPPEDDIHGLS